LEVKSDEGMKEMLISCKKEEKYDKWMEECRLDDKGR
jgi:hypothetical protein